MPSGDIRASKMESVTRRHNCSTNRGQYPQLIPRRALGGSSLYVWRHLSSAATMASRGSDATTVMSRRRGGSCCTSEIPTSYLGKFVASLCQVLASMYDMPPLGGVHGHQRGTSDTMSNRQV